MEENTNQPTSKIEASSVSSTPPILTASKPPRSKFILAIILGIILFLLIAVSIIFFILTKHDTKPISSTQKTTIKKSLNPNTGNLYEDIKVRLKEELK